MTLTRTFTMFSLTIAALMTMDNTAKADRVQDIFRGVRQVQAELGGRTRQASPRHFGPQQPGYGYPGGGCHKQTCPPPPPPCVEYCVYYYNCHCGWKLYGCYRSHWQADQAERHLQHDGYRTYIKVKRRAHHQGGPRVHYPR